MLESSTGGFLISIVFEEQCNFYTFVASSYLFDQADLFCVFWLASFLLLLWAFPTWQASYFIGPVDRITYDLGIVFLTALVLFV